jgi:31-O-methyltransferase
MERHKLPNGLEVFHINPGETRFLYAEIFEAGVYGRHGIALPDAACVFDVGANIGMSALYFRQQRPNVRLYLFEPAPLVFETLRANMRLHRIDARLFDCALSRRAGTASFTYYPNNTIMSGLYADAGDRATTKAFMLSSGFAQDEAEALLGQTFKAASFSCQLRTLSEIIEEEQVERIDLLKIDVEKSERDVLDGLRDPDWPKVKQIVIEVHDLDGRMAALEAELTARGFDVAVDQDPSLAGTNLYDVFGVRGPGRG